MNPTQTLTDILITLDTRPPNFQTREEIRVMLYSLYLFLGSDDNTLPDAVEAVNKSKIMER